MHPHMSSCAPQHIFTLVFSTACSPMSARAATREDGGSPPRRRAPRGHSHELQRLGGAAVGAADHRHALLDAKGPLAFDAAGPKHLRPLPLKLEVDFRRLNRWLHHRLLPTGDANRRRRPRLDGCPQRLTNKKSPRRCAAALRIYNHIFFSPASVARPVTLVRPRLGSDHGQDARYPSRSKRCWKWLKVQTYARHGKRMDGCQLGSPPITAR